MNITSVVIGEVHDTLYASGEIKPAERFQDLSQSYDKWHFILLLPHFKRDKTGFPSRLPVNEQIVGQLEWIFLE